MSVQQPQGGHYDDGYGRQQGQDGYYHDDQYSQYDDQRGNNYHDQQGHGDAYYDESYVCLSPANIHAAN